MGKPGVWCALRVLLSLTVILAVPAYIGVLEQAHDLAHGARTGIAGMWSGFRRELRRSLPWGLLNLAAAAMSGFTLWFYANSRFVFAPALVVFISAAALIYFIWQYFSLACYTLQEEKKIKLAWQNALALLLSRPGVMWLSGLLGAALSFVSLAVFYPSGARFASAYRADEPDRCPTSAAGRRGNQPPGV